VQTLPLVLRPDKYAHYGRALLRGDLRRSSVTYSRYPLRGRGLFGPSQTPATGRRDPSSLLVAPQNRPAIMFVFIRSQH